MQLADKGSMASILPEVPGFCLLLTSSSSQTSLVPESEVVRVVTGPSLSSPCGTGLLCPGKESWSEQGRDLLRFPSGALPRQEQSRCSPRAVGVRAPDLRGWLETCFSLALWPGVPSSKPGCPHLKGGNDTYVCFAKHTGPCWAEDTVCVPGL